VVEPAESESAPQRSRRLVWVVSAGLLFLLLWGWFDLSGRPQYSLYRLGAAIQSRDVVAAQGYFDIEKIADSAAQLLVADYFDRQPQPANDLQVVSRQMARDLAVQQMRPLVAARVRAEIQKTVEAATPQQASLAVPAGLVGAFQSFAVSRQGGDAWISYLDAKQGVTRFRMMQQASRSWKITEFDREWVRRQTQDRRHR
jgi:Protein of unknown function (DUF2939)